MMEYTIISGNRYYLWKKYCWKSTGYVQSGAKVTGHCRQRFKWNMLKKFLQLLTTLNVPRLFPLCYYTI